MRGEELAATVKRLVHEDTVRRIIIKHEGHSVIEIPLTVSVVGTLMNDNRSSRYRQLELPVKKENSVSIHQRKSGQLADLTRHADDCFSLRNLQLALCFLMRGSCRWSGMKTARTDGGDGRASLRISLD